MTSAGSVAGSRRRQVVAGPTNVLANGDFSNGAANWNGFGYSGKAVSGGKAVFTNSPSYDGITQTATFVVGKYYELRYTVAGLVSPATAFPRLVGGSNRNGVIRSANGTFTERLLVNSGNNIFDISLETGGSLSVDDISLVGPYDTATVGGS